MLQRGMSVNDGNELNAEKIVAFVSSQPSHQIAIATGSKIAVACIHMSNSPRQTKTFVRLFGVLVTVEMLESLIPEAGSIVQ